MSCLSLDVGVTTNWPGVDGDAATVANAVLLDTAVNDEMAFSEAVKVLEPLLPEQPPVIGLLMNVSEFGETVIVLDGDDDGDGLAGVVLGDGNADAVGDVTAEFVGDVAGVRLGARFGVLVVPSHEASVAVAATAHVIDMSERRRTCMATPFRSGAFTQGSANRTVCGMGETPRSPIGGPCRRGAGFFDERHR